MTYPYRNTAPDGYTGWVKSHAPFNDVHQADCDSFTDEPDGYAAPCSCDPVAAARAFLADMTDRHPR